MLDMQVIVRYAMMVLTGYLVASGWVDAHIEQPIVSLLAELAPATFAYVWKLYADSKKVAKDLLDTLDKQ
jgi:hypothetical protein